MKLDNLQIINQLAWGQISFMERLDIMKSMADYYAKNNGADVYLTDDGFLSFVITYQRPEPNRIIAILSIGNQTNRLCQTN